MSSTKTTAADRLNLYTWFPYKLGMLGEVQDVILVDEWVYENNGRFSENAHLYPTKVPKHFMGFPIKVAAIGYKVGWKITKNYTQIDDSTVSKPKRVVGEILKCVCDKLNVTTVFVAPSLNTTI
jgi:hypothetical protein